MYRILKKMLLIENLNGLAHFGIPKSLADTPEYIPNV